MNVTITVNVGEYVTAMGTFRASSEDGEEPPDGVLAPTAPHGPLPTLDSHANEEPQ